MCDLNSLSGGGCGINNPPGIRTKLKFIPAEELTNQPRVLGEMVPASTVSGKDNIMNEAFTYVTTEGKGYWRDLDIMVDTGEIAISTSGDPGSLAILNGLNIMVVGLGPAQKEFAQKAANCCLVVAIMDRADKDYYHIIGRFDDAAHITEIGGGTGIKVGDKRALSYKIADTTGQIALSYPVSLGLNLTPNS